MMAKVSSSHRYSAPCGLLAAFAVTLSCAGCTLYSTATQWNGRMGPNGRPVFIKSSTNIGMNLGIVVPILGSTTMGKMVDTTTEEIALENGDLVRVIESSSENYWFGFPPLTWFLTPVVTTVTVEYEPAREEMARIMAERGEQLTPRPPGGEAPESATPPQTGGMERGGEPRDNSDG